MRTGWLKSFLWIFPFLLVGFLPVWASSPEGFPSGSYPGQSEPAGEATAPSGGTAVTRPQDLPIGKTDRLTAEEKEIVTRMELLENLELLENMELFEDFFLVLKEDEEE